MYGVPFKGEIETIQIIIKNYERSDGLFVYYPASLKQHIINLSINISVCGSLQQKNGRLHVLKLCVINFYLKYFMEYRLEI